MSRPLHYGHGENSPVLHTLSQHLRCCLSACTVSSEGHSYVLLSQLLLGDEEHDESSEFHGYKPTAAFLLLEVSSLARSKALREAITVNIIFLKCMDDYVQKYFM